MPGWPYGQLDHSPALCARLKHSNCQVVVLRLSCPATLFVVRGGCGCGERVVIRGIYCTESARAWYPVAVAVVYTYISILPGLHTANQGTCVLTVPEEVL